MEKSDPGLNMISDVKKKKKIVSLFFVCLLAFANDAFNSYGATGVLDVFGRSSQGETRNVDAAWSVLFCRVPTGRGCLYVSWATGYGPPFPEVGGKRLHFSWFRLKCGEASGPLGAPL